MTTASRCGSVAIAGRPNVGKSTLLNRLIGRKLSITSRKPQTTRARLLGIKTEGQDQIIYVDTPGLQARAPRELNRLMTREVLAALREVDVIVFVVVAGRWCGADAHVLTEIQRQSAPVLLAMNKIDRVADKRELLAELERHWAGGDFAEIVPVSARFSDNLAALEQSIRKFLPQRPHLFPEDQLSDRNERYLAAEFLREKLIRLLGEELPYSAGVVVDDFAEQGELVQISATVWVERPGQKAIVIGENGMMLKRIGEQARHDIERLLGKRVFLRTWVKVRKNWADDPRLVRELDQQLPTHAR